MHRRAIPLVVLCFAFLLAACGGGGTATTQSSPLQLAGTVSTVAGGGVSTLAGTAPSFYDPIDAVRIGDFLYVTDTLARKIWKVEIATGETTALAGGGAYAEHLDGTGSAARFEAPAGITSDGANLYVTDAHRIRKVTIATGVVTTLAGGTYYGTTDGTGTAASFFQPRGLWTDNTNLYVADTGNGKIRKVVIASGVVTTVARGSDGIRSPGDITSVDGEIFYIASSDNVIRKLVAATREVTTFAGATGWTPNSGADDTTATSARFYAPAGITTDGTNLFVADYRNHAIRKIVIATGEVTTVAGSARNAGSADGTGAEARFNLPSGIATDGTDLFVVDRLNFSVRKVAIESGEVTTLAGTADSIFNAPEGVVAVGGNLFVADTAHHAIRKVTVATGEVTTLAGSAGVSGSADGTGEAARFYGPTGLATDGTNLYVADSSNFTIRKVVIATGVVTTIAGRAEEYGSMDGTRDEATFNRPYGLALDGTNLYITDAGSHTVRKLDLATDEVTTVAGVAGVVGHSSGLGAAATFNSPSGIATDGVNLYVADTANCTIRKIVLATGAVTTLAGYPENGGTEDGTGSEAHFLYPAGVVSDGTNLYVTDTNHTIRKIVIATRVVTTIAGAGENPGSEDGAGVDARFYYPTALATDGSALYVADTFNNAIRVIR
jgi:sugar lactone lactonase YvrE